jgi:Tol biopolymer transport system component/DNA-binding winged helix-turn-helix (wHTH) protein
MPETNLESQTSTPIALTGRFTLGDFRVDVGGLKLWDAQNLPRRLTPKSMAVLCELALRAGETVPRDALLNAVWPDTCPTPEVLTQAIKELRKAFQDTQKAPQYIETIAKTGYRLLKIPNLQAQARAMALSPIELGPAPSAVAPNVVAPDLVAPSPIELSPIAPSVVAPHAAAHSTLAMGTPEVAPPTKRANTRILLPLALSLLLCALAYFSFRGAPSNAAQDWSKTRLSEIKQSQRMLTSAPGVETAAVLSSDGKWLAYVADTSDGERILLRDLTIPNARRLSSNTPEPQATRELLPRFSSDGLSVAFLRYRSRALDALQIPAPKPNSPVSPSSDACEIMAQRLSGGPLRKLMDCPEGLIAPFEWPQPDELIYSARTVDAGSSTLQPIQSVGIYSYLLSTQTATRLVSKPGESVYDWQAKRSPDGKKLAFRRGGNIDSTLFFADADGQNAVVVAQLGENARGFDWLADSSGVIAALAQDTDFSLFKITPNRAPKNLGIAGQFPSIADDHRLVFSVEQERSALQEFDLQNAHSGATLFASTSTDELPSLAPDGQTIAFQSTRGGIFQIWYAKRATTPQAATLQNARASNIDWAADGKRFLFAQRRSIDEDSRIFEFDLERAQLREMPTPAALGHIVRIVYLDPTQRDRFLILSSKNGHRQLQQWRILTPPNFMLEWQLPNVGSFQRDLQSAEVYLTQVANNTLFVRTSSGALRAVFNQFEPQFLWHWRVHAGVVYYAYASPIPSSASYTGEGVTLRRRDLLNHSDSVIRLMPGGDLALDLARQIAIVPVKQTPEINIGSVMLGR